MTKQFHPSVCIQQKWVCMFAKRQTRMFIAAPFITARNYWETTQISFNSRTAFHKFGISNRTLYSNEHMNHCSVSMNYVSQIQCWANEATNRRVHSIEFYLHKGLKQANLISAVREQDSGQLPLVGGQVQVVPGTDTQRAAGCQQHSVTSSECWIHWCAHFVKINQVGHLRFVDVFVCMYVIHQQNIYFKVFRKNIACNYSSKYQVPELLPQS